MSSQYIKMAEPYTIGDSIEVVGSDETFLGSLYEAIFVGYGYADHVEVEYTSGSAVGGGLGMLNILTPMRVTMKSLC
ncbi:hypothetical protein V2J09_022144 [Rumex salicifolius]